MTNTYKLQVFVTPVSSFKKGGGGDWSIKFHFWTHIYK